MPPPVLVWALLATAALALLPARLGGRGEGIAAGIAALGTVLLAATGIAAPFRAGPGWLADPVAAGLSLLAGLPWLMLAVWSVAARPVWPRRRRQRWRRWPFAGQLAVTGAVVSCCADPLALALSGAAMAFAGAMLLRDRPADTPLLPVSALFCAVLGTMMLSAGSGRPVHWSGFGSGLRLLHPALPVLGPVLVVLPLLLVAWSGLVEPRPARWPAADAAGLLMARVALPVPLAVPALAAVLRLRGSLAGDPAMAAQAGSGLAFLALGAILVAAALVPARRALDDRCCLAGAIQLGAILSGLASNDPGASMGALMLLAALSLALPAALLPVRWGRAGAARVLPVLALVGLPPFLSFPAGFLLLSRGVALSSGPGPWGALVLLGGSGVAAAGVLSALRRERDAVGPAGVLARLPVLAALLLLAWMGLAMPSAASEWLLGLADPLAGFSGAMPPR